MEKGGRKMQGEDTQKWKMWNIRMVTFDNSKHCWSELYGQEVSYYGEGLIVTGEAMNQLGDMRWVNGIMLWIINQAAFVAGEW